MSDDDGRESPEWDADLYAERVASYVDTNNTAQSQTLPRRRALVVTKDKSGFGRRGLHATALPLHTGDERGPRPDVIAVAELLDVGNGAGRRLDEDLVRLGVPQVAVALQVNAEPDVRERILKKPRSITNFPD